MNGQQIDWDSVRPAPKWYRCLECDHIHDDFPGTGLPACLAEDEPNFELQCRGCGYISFLLTAHFEFIQPPVGAA